MHVLLGLAVGLSFSSRESNRWYTLFAVLEHGRLRRSAVCDPLKGRALPKINGMVFIGQMGRQVGDSLLFKGTATHAHNSHSRSFVDKVESRAVVSSIVSVKFNPLSAGIGKRIFVWIDLHDGMPCAVYVGASYHFQG
ncbi:uncharacterized protein BP01DRAFT_182791 [Aspergillus saccharolyticus JOP 1030-1]|uniref:Uncharacterized protein n=1 Tax=Aspergillus saccharolyticus JOP 1030-1 TaxID=1450539 RepID=A0A318Z932_9EURO|nr:hypothetical protein BP01DRAFT_182791 [Aspergillus saccharolyticus JOP 1030-1]PYH41223.1 hypothetical protein BP01DRAFT_182791 [Aspergillus saccharolyticus JOP 1030-1]